MPKQREPKNKLNSYAKYSSVAVQMAVVICLGVFGGYKLDDFLNLDFPIFTLLLAMSSVALAVYLAVRDIVRHNS